MPRMKFAGLDDCLSCIDRYECERTIKSVMREGCNLYLSDDEFKVIG